MSLISILAGFWKNRPPFWIHHFVLKKYDCRFGTRNPENPYKMSLIRIWGEFWKNSPPFWFHHFVLKKSDCRFGIRNPENPYKMSLFKILGGLWKNRPPFWIRHFVFKTSDGRIGISTLENPPIQIFMAKFQLLHILAKKNRFGNIVQRLHCAQPRTCCTLSMRVC